MKFSAENPRLRKAANRCTHFMSHSIKMFFGPVISLSICFGCDSISQDNSALAGKDKQVVVDFPEIGQNIKIRSRVWGVAGNHEETSIFSGDGSNAAKSTVKQIFYTSEIFYKKRGKDTLVVFAPNSSFKDDVLKVIGNVQLEIHSLKGFDEVQHYSRKYQDLGLNRISAYE